MLLSEFVVLANFSLTFKSSENILFEIRVAISTSSVFMKYGHRSTLVALRASPVCIYTVFFYEVCYVHRGVSLVACIFAYLACNNRT